MEVWCKGLQLSCRPQVSLCAGAGVFSIAGLHGSKPLTEGLVTRGSGAHEGLTRSHLLMHTAWRKEVRTFNH